MEQKPPIIEHLIALLTEANQIEQDVLARRWAFTVSSFLKAAGYTDSAGAWKAKLAQELVQAKLAIDLTALLAG
jgi:hypothetical protein